MSENKAGIMSLKELNRNQQRFVSLYLKSSRFNQTLAYMEAYGEDDEKAAASNASTLIRNHKVSKAIDDVLRQRIKRADVTAQKVLAELAAISFVDVRQFYDEDGCLKDFSELNIQQQAAIQSIETKEMFEDKVKIGVEKKLKFHSKTKALELLCRNLGILKDSGGVVPGVGGININNYINAIPQRTIVFKDVSEDEKHGHNQFAGANRLHAAEGPKGT